MVDAEGVVIRTASTRPQVDGRRVPLVSGVAHPTAPGQTVPGDARVGIELLASVARWDDPVEREHLAYLDEVSVANLGGRRDPREPEVVLGTARPTPWQERPTACRVEWGRADTDRGEAPLEHKVRHVLTAFAMDARLTGFERVMVAFDELRVVPVVSPWEWDLDNATARLP